MKRIHIITEAALTKFAEVAYANRYRLFKAWLVSPWLTYEVSKIDPISFLVEALRETHAKIHLITRKPERSWHYEAVRALWHNASVVLYYCATLHTKLYILECDGFRYAMMGSPNLTSRANQINREIAVEFRTSVQSVEDEIACAVTCLTDYAKSLVSEDNVILQHGI